MYIKTCAAALVELVFRLLSQPVSETRCGKLSLFRLNLSVSHCQLNFDFKKNEFCHKYANG